MSFLELGELQIFLLVGEDTLVTEGAVIAEENILAHFDFLLEERLASRLGCIR